ncbi:uncharacterized protein MONBRDRAFT_8378 [Monosiga brevicollis MX1]|uniref:LamG-like jellyroll fold domain-containing protein n=1 Tax=Monosiga brevicollis TaxID=81824 RepID=A9V0M7_MONBE|nr:uncharacterized protein MONBRDRAFT_8378 [Monosiga brevicollis MX1]EDQ88907.1 predicted protein [Monosiga brevicollis MX1]|eukprot:XP_001746012.1 hypothetical protein [Monosiga brevicollis MX1]
MAVTRWGLLLGLAFLASPALAVDCTGNFEESNGQGGCQCMSGFAYRAGVCTITNEIVTEANKIVLKAADVVLRAPNSGRTSVMDTSIAESLRTLGDASSNSATRLDTIESSYVTLDTVRALEQSLHDLSNLSESFVDEVLLESLVPRIATNEMEDVVCQNSSDLRVIRYHLFGRHLEYCDQWRDTFYWHQMGLPVRCRYGNASSGVCHACIEGYVTARGGKSCVLQGDLLHLAFDDNLFDQSELGRDARFFGVSNDYTFGNNAYASADSTPYLRLNGNGEHIRVEPLTFGGDMSICVDVYYEETRWWSRILDFSASAEGSRESANFNIILSNVETSSRFNFEIYDGPDSVVQIQVADLLNVAYHQWAQLCVTANGGTYTAYANGNVTSIQSGPPVPWVRRFANYVGRSNWPGDADFHGYMDNLRIFSRALSTTDIAEMYADTRFPAPKDDYLFARYEFEGNALDSSGNGNDATPFNHLPFNAYQRRAPQGRYAMQFDGEDDYIVMPALSFDNAFGFCFHIRWYDLDFWSRVLDIHNAAGDGILLAHIANSETLQLAVQFPDDTPQSTLEVVDGWALARGAYQHYCFSMTNNTMAVYRQGRLLLSQSDKNPIGSRSYANAFIGKSAYDADATLGAEVDDLHIFKRGVAIEDVQRILCDGKATLDCVGLLGHWKFDGNVLDSSNNQWHGELVPVNQQVGSHFISDDAKQGTAALSFTGNNSYVQLPARRLGGANDVTFCVWAKFGNADEWERVFDFGDGDNTNRVYLARSSTNEEIIFDVRQGNGNNDVRGPLPSSSDYVHICASIDSDGGHLYVNGGLIQDNNAVPRLNLGDFTHNFVGKSLFDWDASTEGVMDDLRMYGYALSASEIKNLYNMYK